MPSTYRVAVVESDPDVRDLLIELLTDAGCVVYTVSRAEDLFAEWAPDVVLADAIGAPYSTESAVATITGFRKRLDAGVVVLTGSRQVVDDAPLLGANAIVMKPFETEHLVSIVLAIAADPHAHTGTSRSVLIAGSHIRGREPPPALPRPLCLF
jgi:DNA-binding response OmpR family regulator